MPDHHPRYVVRELRGGTMPRRISANERNAVAAWRDDRPGVGVRFYVGLAYGLWLSAIVVLLGIVLWRLWTEVLGAWPA